MSTAAGSESPPGWHEVLAAVEADARRASELLVAPPADVTAVPGEWALPGAALPALDSMPPVPEALRHRIHELRSRIDELQSELVHALGDMQLPSRGHFATQSGGQPVYVDRRV